MQVSGARCVHLPTLEAATRRANQSGGGPDHEEFFPDRANYHDFPFGTRWLWAMADGGYPAGATSRPSARKENDEAFSL